jgi:hypothetical protein
MAGVVYFGTKDKQSWIKSPNSGMRANNVAWSTKNLLLNGRASVRRSKASHREFNAEWVGSLNSGLDSSLQEIKNYFDGLYGDGPYYFLDPYAASQNVLPPHWAAPMLTENDWPNLATGITPSFFASSVSNGYPVKYLGIVTTDDYVSDNVLTLIIPPTHKLEFGWHGPAGGSDSGVRIVPYIRSTGLADTAINPTMITAGGTTRTNTTVSGETYSRVDIFLATTLAAELAITGMIAQIIPSSDSVATGGFIAGKGTTQLEFENAPEIEYYSAAIGGGQIGMSVNWIEV